MKQCLDKFDKELDFTVALQKKASSHQKDHQHVSYVCSNYSISNVADNDFIPYIFLMKMYGG